MFGLYRTFLALLVAFHHLSGIRFQGSTVFCFYMLSGYLMTLIMHDNYGYSLAGIRRFAISRFLKIYPLYWIACLTSIFLIVCLGIHYTKAYHSKIFLPENLTQILRNFFVIFSIQSSPRLVPPTWALTVQFFFYILIASGISKTKKITTIWFLISICYTFYTSIAQLDRIYRFFAIPAASFPFSAGALIYHYKNKILAVIGTLRSQKATVFLLIILIGNFLLNRKLGILYSWEFYSNLVLNGLLIINLSESKSIFGLSKAVDKQIGNLSYPIYLLHYQCGLLISMMGFNMKRGQPFFGLLSLPLIVLVSWLIDKRIVLPLDNIKRGIKVNRQLQKESNHPPPKKQLSEHFLPVIHKRAF